jgi:hypothetical protein
MELQTTKKLMLGAWGQKKTIAQRMAETAASPSPAVATSSSSVGVVEEKKKPVVLYEATNVSRLTRLHCCYLLYIVL